MTTATFSADCADAAVASHRNRNKADDFGFRNSDFGFLFRISYFELRLLNLQSFIKPPFMSFDQYHEPASELSQKTRTFARMLTSLTEEAEAIGWYEQRISLEKDKEAKQIMEKAQEEEFIHFAMDLEFLLRQKDKWKLIMKNVLFKEGSITENAEKAEQKAEK